MTMKVGVIGLGNMGGGMAATLAGKGFDVSGFDLSEAALAQAKEKGVKPITDRKQLIKESDVLILSLPKAEHVEAVCLGQGGIIEFGREGLIVVDTTTSTPEASRKVATALARMGIAFIDAPVSGGPKGAATGTMSMVIGAEDADLARAMPVLEGMSGTRVHVGKCGAGNVAKIANNMLAACHLISTAEAVSMAAKAGVEPEKLLQGLNAGSGRSGATQVMFPNWVLNKAYDSGFTMGLMRKDVGLASDLADSLDLDLPLSRIVALLWEASSESLPDNEDFCAIVQRTDAKLYGRENNQ
ncbi:MULTISPECIES: NAD(P)-dependent oxidoreductase [Pseudomonas]|uniref:Putative 3-hydroxyisobutyrate dehydrogenase n=1 Tax=Pseudomonas brassicacearum (strain NFM421) TaxID=994484 RepID=F2KGG3_PSEBN|nr:MULTISPECIES: NAD(P)-dependent oxidoreductase [Pseudomonas]EIK65001.1 3-hydroxyisobutyrate dehydrogenase family protein [Pseudomonas fluorescens Q8r1-96]KIR18344.1 2-(hydroxymethyl)glutarate dehydrogenase [Pseudomonas fluorescens]AEA68422.1 putative 3-hydroxyisobutyrate dehydrogenase [Pseudomonas brassicacearum subsp. brassicacearum NFM421]ALQ02986.1 3-hydroxyisobutyrate dehydrogenase [Pseudomonas brassicacearum]AOS38232.1 3-hydroxyisobutyrate dehydrogenase [Pseudomonas brassicacearum]